MVSQVKEDLSPGSVKSVHLCRVTYAAYLKRVNEAFETSDL